MRAKFFVLAIAIGIFAGTAAYSAGPVGLTGFGIYGTAGKTAGGLSGGMGLSAKWGNFPVVGLLYDFSAGKLGASVDYYIIDAKGIANNFSWFLGAGAYIGISLGKFDGGLRIPVGIQFWPVEKLELFVSPVLSIPLIPAPDIGIGAEFGLRIRF